MNNIKLKIILSTVILLNILVLSLGTPILAVETTTTKTPDDEATQSASLENIKKIIKDNIENSKVKGAIDNLLNRKVALLGEVTRVTDETITISNRLGTRIIPLAANLSITKDGKEIKVTDIAVENWVTILGKIKDDDFSPSFIFVSTESLQPKTQYIKIGTITKVSKTSITIKPRSDETEKEIFVTKTTSFEDLNGVAMKLTDLSEDITVLVSGHETETKVEATTIRSLAPITESNE